MLPEAEARRSLRYQELLGLGVVVVVAARDAGVRGEDENWPKSRVFSISTKAPRGSTCFGTAIGEASEAGR